MAKILVTGGAGHVGSHIVEQLQRKKKNHVVSLDNYFNGSVKNHIQGATYIKGDTKDIENLIPHDIDMIYHLGEYARIAPSINEPERVIEMNIVGTTSVLEYCRKYGSKLVYAASSTKFASDGKERNANIYSYTKAANVDLINNYGKWYNIPYAICYFYNAYGPRENGVGKYATLIAKFEQIYLSGGVFTIDKPGTQKRNFTHVSDLARGMIMVGEKGYGDGYALGHRKSHSILEIAKAFGGEIVYTDNYSGRLKSGKSPNKAREELGWETTVDVIDYIEEFKRKNPINVLFNKSTKNQNE